MEPLTVNAYLTLDFFGFLAGFVDSIAGGGGLVSLPALISVGLPPHLAIGTNKLQGTFGSLTATLNYRSKNLVSIEATIQGIFWTALGAITGAVSIQYIPSGFLNGLIPTLLLIVFFYMLLTPEIGEKSKKAAMPAFLFYPVMGLALGFYDGFFGPGTGSFWTLAFVLLLGLNLTKATAHTKVMNFTSNIVALVTFVLGHQVMFSAGLVMGVGQVCGAYAGSRLVILKGVKFVRVFFLCVVAATVLKLVLSAYYR